MANKVIQKERILKYMNDFGSISPKEAMADLGVMRLASRICDLKKDGVAIIKEMETSKNRYGEPTRYARYRLEDKKDE
jgi:hypothetical protein